MERRDGGVKSGSSYIIFPDGRYKTDMYRENIHPKKYPHVHPHLDEILSNVESSGELNTLVKNQLMEFDSTSELTEDNTMFTTETDVTIEPVTQLSDAEATTESIATTTDTSIPKWKKIHRHSKLQRTAENEVVKREMRKIFKAPHIITLKFY